MSGSGHRNTRHGRTESHRRILTRRDQLTEQELDQDAAADLATLDTDEDDDTGAVA